ncbi:hypothetical protein BC628DRAFT_511629 [Trametes gibbosa]|nr:hypothetical protein BC628DRAFT_511629 [Trametes gibbosa]
MLASVPPPLAGSNAATGIYHAPPPPPVRVVHDMGRIHHVQGWGQVVHSDDSSVLQRSAAGRATRTVDRSEDTGLVAALAARPPLSSRLGCGSALGSVWVGGWLESRLDLVPDDRRAIFAWQRRSSAWCFAIRPLQAIIACRIDGPQHAGQGRDASGIAGATKSATVSVTDCIHTRPAGVPFTLPLCRLTSL